ncbi:twin-arginine translocase TatA/TatE family subunit [Salinigranum rubrum]|uniref:Sec-independent protein translocase protein TatA n=1 Tax=Salinigranum rubrum TaxID=755307 RepID=A0A2I8VHU9_9EURY|nr:twin-arginine translocase TatA/TatE family subunit [Salinigranum rubrum]AUV81501.1 twin-arginine translocase TatA/TatE family subunit [Salinigranum rubrum]
MFDIILFPGLPGGPELLIVLFVLVLLFGANKIPKLARSTGQAMGEFQRGRQEIEEELKQMEKQPDEDDEEFEARKREKERELEETESESESESTSTSSS